MNTRTLKLTAVVLLAGHASYAPADYTANLETLGSSSTSTDAFTLDCPEDTDNVRVRVTDLNNINRPVAMLYVMVMDPITGDSEGATDTSEGNSTNWSGWSFPRVYGDLGPYDVSFEKVNNAGDPAGGTESYRGEAECYNASNNALVGEDLH